MSCESSGKQAWNTSRHISRPKGDRYYAFDICLRACKQREQPAFGGCCTCNRSRRPAGRCARCVASGLHRGNATVFGGSSGLPRQHAPAPALTRSWTGVGGSDASAATCRREFYCGWRRSRDGEGPDDAVTAEVRSQLSSVELKPGRLSVETYTNSLQRFLKCRQKREMVAVDLRRLADAHLKRPFRKACSVGVRALCRSLTVFHTLHAQGRRTHILRSKRPFVP